MLICAAMTLNEFMALPGKRRADFAKLIGVTPAMVSQWLDGTRPVSPERCVEIEQRTSGQVTRKDLRPTDWHRIWPELLASDTATTAQAAA